MNVLPLTVLSGSANPALSLHVVEQLGVGLGACSIERFPDGELHVEVQDSVRGHDVYLVQPTSPPAESQLFTLLLLADACRRAGAAHLTAIMPYVGYARQDRRAGGREPVAARLVADLLQTSGLQRVVAVDLHTAAMEGFFAIPLEHLSAVSLLAEAVRPQLPADSVVVAPDLGAAKLAERYARLLHLPVAIVHKTRISGEEVRVSTITGAVQNRAPLIVDDMISTGSTIEAAITALLAAGCLPRITVAAGHGLFVGSAGERLRATPIERMVVTDSVVLPVALPLPLEVVSLAPLLAQVMTRLHESRSLGDLLIHG